MRQHPGLLPPLAVLAALAAACGSSAKSIPTPGPSGPPTMVTLLDITGSINVTGGSTGTYNFAGQSMTLPGTATYDSVHFNWYTYRGTPTAFGTAFVLDREYLGLPGSLGASTPGYLGQATATIEGNPGPTDEVKGEYAFPASMSLRGGTKYWIYTNKQGSFVDSFDKDLYPGGDLYCTGVGSAPFRKIPASGRYVNGGFVPGPAGVYTDANFKLQALTR